MVRQFTGRKLVVIGGSSGIGRQVAAHVAAAGGSAAIAGHRPDKAGQTVAELSANGTAWARRSGMARLESAGAHAGRPQHLDAHPTAPRRQPPGPAGGLLLDEGRISMPAALRIALLSR